MGALDGKIAIVTGSGQGIGRGIAIGLAREGAKVITNNRAPQGYSAQFYRKEDMPESDWNEFNLLKGDAEGTAQLIIDEGNTAIPFYGDVSDWKTAKQLIELAMEKFGRIDIIVNGAAGMGKGGIEELDEQTWDKIYVSRNRAAFNMMHFAVPIMKKQKFGRFINISSDAWIGLPDNDAYSASTAGMVGLTYAASKELYRHGITVNAICPQGASPSHAVEYNKMVRNVAAITGKAPDPKVLAAVEADHGNPTGLGPFVSFLCTEDASYISRSIFSATSAGKVSVYTMPVQTNQIFKNGEMWTIDELKEVVPRDLLGENYDSIAKNTGW